MSPRSVVLVAALATLGASAWAALDSERGGLALLLAALAALTAGFAWHDVLHAVAAVHRGRLWRAHYYIGLLRWRTLTLAGADMSEYKGADDVDPELLPERPGFGERRLILGHCLAPPCAEEAQQEEADLVGHELETDHFETVPQEADVALAELGHELPQQRRAAPQFDQHGRREKRIRVRGELRALLVVRLAEQPPDADSRRGQAQQRGGARRQVR